MDCFHIRCWGRNLNNKDKNVRPIETVTNEKLDSKCLNLRGSVYFVIAREVQCIVVRTYKFFKNTPKLWYQSAILKGKSDKLSDFVCYMYIHTQVNNIQSGVTRILPFKYILKNVNPLESVRWLIFLLHEKIVKKSLKYRNSNVT